jgi:hypothetical protein
MQIIDTNKERVFKLPIDPKNPHLDGGKLFYHVLPQIEHERILFKFLNTRKEIEPETEEAEIADIKEPETEKLLLTQDQLIDYQNALIACPAGIYDWEGITDENGEKMEFDSSLLIGIGGLDLKAKIVSALLGDNIKLKKKAEKKPK